MTDMKIVVFGIGGQDYAADIHEVREVIRAPRVTPLPHPTPPMVGVFNLRGHIVTAVDGATLLGLEQTTAAPERAVILQGQGRTIGLLVDAARHVLTVPETSVQSTGGAEHVRSALGIILHDGKPIVLLDVRALLEERSTEPRAPA